MLLQIDVKNLAIIDQLHISFGPGLNILTGETGAGKSIIREALQLSLGERASTDLIRTGENEVVIEAFFDIEDSKNLRESIGSMGIDSEGTLLLKRKASRDGKNKIWINGQPVTLRMLSQIAENLMDIHGQHYHQRLLRPEMHLDFLDRYGNFIPLREKFNEQYRKHRELSQRIEGLERLKRETERQKELWILQEREIRGAALKHGEDEELLQERNILLHQEKINEACSNCYKNLYSGKGSVIEKLSEVRGWLKEISQYDPSFKDLSENLETIYYQIEDHALTIRNYTKRIELNPQRLKDVEDRWDQIERLKKKYGRTIQDILNYGEKVKKDLENLLNLDDELEDIQKKLEKTRDEAYGVAQVLSRRRKDTSLSLEKEIEEELSSLGFKRIHFKMIFQELEICPKGLEKGEFYISLNPGEEPRPLAKIASGGELSRIMLALTKGLMDEEGAPTVFFDEVDAGIGGSIAEVVGRKLKEISKKFQVICITHLPQIASFADSHYFIKKTIQGGRTFTYVEELQGDERVKEIARMVGGIEITHKTTDYAREMIQRAQVGGKNGRRIGNI